MNWKDGDSAGFFSYLMDLSTVSKDAMYQALYNTLIENHEKILNQNNVPRQEVENALDNLIQWFEQKERYEQCQKIKQINHVEIGDGTWIGENVCILGVKIGKNCVIGANSVVTKDIPDYSVVVGSPAVIIKKFNITANRWEKSD